MGDVTCGCSGMGKDTTRPKLKGAVTNCPACGSAIDGFCAAKPLHCAPMDAHIWLRCPECGARTSCCGSKEEVLLQWPVIKAPVVSTTEEEE